MDNKPRIGDKREIVQIQQGIRKELPNMFIINDYKLLIRRYLENLPVSCESDKTIKAFLNYPNTLQYGQVAFTTLPTPPNTINCWAPPTAQPQSRNYSLIGKFLKTVICNGENETYAYLIHYLAHMWQKSEEKLGVAIVLLGGQSTGKGTFSQLLQKIWTRKTLQVSLVEHVVGVFYAAMKRSSVVNMEKALFSGDRKSIHRFKSIITEPTTTIEQKYRPRRTIQSLHRFFATSNHDHFGNIELDDRRFVFLRISKRLKATLTNLIGFTKQLMTPRN